MIWFKYLVVPAYIIMATGVLTFGISILGILRMPDSFTRIHAGTKASTLGTLLILLGAMLLKPLWIPKLMILGVFILFTNPVSSSILVKGAYLGGSPMKEGEGQEDFREELSRSSDSPAGANQEAQQ